MKAFDKVLSGPRAYTPEERAALEQEFRSLMIRSGKGELLEEHAPPRTTPGLSGGQSTQS